MDCILALRAAAGRANVASDTRTVAFRALFLAKFAGDAQRLYRSIGSVNYLASRQRVRRRAHGKNLNAVALRFAGCYLGETSSSYHRKMPRSDVYLKVELDLDERESPERLASEICRLIRKVYGVRQAEVSSIVERET
jgi:hypothetical protein